MNLLVMKIIPKNFKMPNLNKNIKINEDNEKFLCFDYKKVYSL